jgi:hypothetical protein
MAISSYFGCFRLRQPLPAETGGGISGGSIGNPDSPAESGDAADASCTGAWEVGSRFTTAGGRLACLSKLQHPSPPLWALTARTFVALDEWDAVIAATLASSAQIGRSVASSPAPLLPEMRSFAWTARAVSIDPQTDNNTTTGEVAAQTALYPPRLTTVAWPGPACRGDTT